MATHAYAATYLCAAAVSVLSALVLRVCAVCGQPCRARAAGAGTIGSAYRQSGPSVTWCASPLCGGHAVRRGQLHADELQ